MELVPPPLINKTLIRSLYEKVVDLPDYQIPGQENFYSGKATNIGEKLDHIVTAARPTIIGDTHLKPEYRAGEGRESARKVLFTNLNSVQSQLYKVNTATSGALPPLVADTRRAFVNAYHLFNPEDSYGNFCQSVLQHAADTLELGDLSKIPPQFDRSAQR